MHNKTMDMDLCRRRDKRIECDQKVLLLRSDDLTLQARATNISMAGLEIRCNQQVAEEVKPFWAPIKEGGGDSLSLKVCLNDGSKPLQLTCAVINMYRLSQDVFSFNLKFTPLEEQEQQQLEGFINA